MTRPLAFCFHLTMGREGLYNLELPESCSSLPHPPVNRGAEKRDALPWTGLDFMNVGRDGGQKPDRGNCVMYTKTRRKICRKFSGQRDAFWCYCCGFFLFPWFFVAGSGLARVSYLGPFHRHSTQRTGSGRAVDTGPGIRVWTFSKKRGCARPRPLEKQHNYARKAKKHRPFGRCFFADASPTFWSEWRESNSRPLEPHYRGFEWLDEGRTLS